ncbi:MAG: sigma-70 family RNA polymerase sigma factor [Litoreibacter sp.]|nr:sigma-70 family RNA polymerase sigma factor [Litoreibacter sp.]
MLTGALLNEKPDAMPGLAPHGVQPEGKRKGFQRRKVPADVNTDTHWVEIVARIRQSQDQAAFAELFQHFAPRVKAFLIKSGADAGMAEECAQDVMATLWRKAHLFDPSRASVATWIFTIARNRRIDMLRKERRPEPDELTWGPAPEPDAADVMELQQENNRLAEAMAELPEKQRVLIQKAYFGDLSHSEIAEQTGLPLGTIKSRIRLALERLRHVMK